MKKTIRISVMAALLTALLIIGSTFSFAAPNELGYDAAKTLEYAEAHYMDTFEYEYGEKINKQDCVKFVRACLEAGGVPAEEGRTWGYTPQAYIEYLVDNGYAKLYDLNMSEYTSGSWAGRSCVYGYENEGIIAPGDVLVYKCLYPECQKETEREYYHLEIVNNTENKVTCYSHNPNKGPELGTSKETVITFPHSKCVKRVEEFNEEEAEKDNPELMDPCTDKHCKIMVLHFLQPGECTKHTWNSGEVVIAPTCTEKGTKAVTCVNCGETDTVVVNALGHKEVKDVAVDASFTEDGYTEGKHCSVCGTVTVAQKVIPMVSDASLSYTAKTYTGKTLSAPKLTIKDANGKTLVKNTDYTTKGLVSKKYVGRYKVTVTLKGKYAGTKDLYFMILPKAPSSATATVATGTGGYDDIKFSWKKATGASGYDVYYKEASEADYTFIKKTTGTYVTVKDLAPATKYYFKVVAYYKNSGVYYPSLSSKSSYAYTLKKLDAPVVTKSGTKVKVKWVNISGESGYQVSKSTKATGTSIASTYKTTTGTYKTIKATKGKTYYYKVRAYKTVSGKKVYGPWSDAVSFVR